MLPTFRIRDLRRPRTPPRPSLSVAAKPNHDALVRVTAPEYESTILANPDAKLLYVDEDDGEVVTVGSSLELSQRLSEPPLPSARKGDSTPKTIALPTGVSMSPIYPVTPSYHIFDIDRRGNSVNVWLEIEAQNNRAEQARESTSPNATSNARSTDQLPNFRQVTFRDSSPTQAADSSVPLRSERPVTDDLEVQVDASDDESRHQEMLRYQKRSLDLARLPSISNVEGTFASRYAGRLREKVLHGILSTQSDDSKPTTLEGKRQAQSAGEKTRNRTTSGRHVVGNSTYVTPLNGWSIYNDGNGVLNYPFPGSSVPAVTLTSEGKRQAQAAGDKLRTRTNPVRHAKPGRIESGVSKNRWPVYSGSRPLRFDDRLSTVAAPDAAEGASQPKKQHDENRPLLKIFEAEMSKLGVGADKQEASEDVPTFKQDNLFHAISPRATTAQNNLAISRSMNALEFFLKVVKDFADIAGNMGSELKNPLAKITSSLSGKTPEMLALSDYFRQLRRLELQKELRARVAKLDAFPQVDTKILTRNTAAVLSDGEVAMPNTNEGNNVNTRVPTLGSESATQSSSQDVQHRKRSISPFPKQKAAIQSRVEPNIPNLLNPEPSSSHLSGAPLGTDNVPDPVGRYESSNKQDHPSTVTVNGDTHHSWQPFARPSYIAYQPPISYPLTGPPSFVPHNSISYHPLNGNSHRPNPSGPALMFQGHRQYSGRANPEITRTKLNVNESQRTLAVEVPLPTAARVEEKASLDLPRFPPLPSMEALEPSRAQAPLQEGQDSVNVKAQSCGLPNCNFTAISDDLMHNHGNDHVEIAVPDCGKVYPAASDMQNYLEWQLRHNFDRGMLSESEIDRIKAAQSWDQARTFRVPSNPPQAHLPTPPSARVSGSRPRNPYETSPISSTDETEAYETSGEFFKRMTGVRASRNKYNYDDEDDDPRHQMCRGEQPSFNNAEQSLIIFDKEGVQISGVDVSPPTPDSAEKTSESKTDLEQFREKWLKEIMDGKYPTTGNTLAPPPRPGSLVSENGTLRRLPKIPAKPQNTLSLPDPKARVVQEMDVTWGDVIAHAERTMAASDKEQADALRANDQIAECVKWLKEMGYGRKWKDGETRLVMIAQAAHGNLVEAIDMMDEEEKAYEWMSG